MKNYYAHNSLFNACHGVYRNFADGIKRPMNWQVKWNIATSDDLYQVNHASVQYFATTYPSSIISASYHPFALHPSLNIGRTEDERLSGLIMKQPGNGDQDAEEDDEDNELDDDELDEDEEGNVGEEGNEEEEFELEEEDEELNGDEQDLEEDQEDEDVSPDDFDEDEDEFDEDEDEYDLDEDEYDDEDEDDDGAA